MNPKIVKLDSFPKEDFEGEVNPFLHDVFSMGTKIEKDIYMMYANHPGEKFSKHTYGGYDVYFINVKTRKRFGLSFGKEE